MSSPPAWSIGRGKRSTVLKDDFAAAPGPGAYSFSNLMKQKAPSWRIGTSNRKSITFSDTPGPGCYQTPIKSRVAPKYSFGLKTLLREKDTTPGPGTYELRRRSEDVKNTGFSFPHKSFAIDYRTDSPGPGAYDQNSLITNHRPGTCKIGTSKRSEIYNTKDSPGPGAYVVSTVDRTRAPICRIGTSQRSDLGDITKFAPGPGAYTLSNLFNATGKGFTIVGKRPDTAASLNVSNPGPGAYTPSGIGKRKSPACRIGSASRSIGGNMDTTNPGPGNYDLNISFGSTGVRIGTGKRQPLNERSITPGPGAYQNQSKRSGPKVIIIPRRPDTSLSRERESPGPGAYSPAVELVKNNNPKAKIGTSTREGFGLVDDIPGPGTYSTQGTGEGPKWRFSSAARNRSLNNKSAELNPGPGAYNLPPKFADVPSYAISGSLPKNAL